MVIITATCEQKVSFLTRIHWDLGILFGQTCTDGNNFGHENAL